MLVIAFLKVVRDFWSLLFSGAGAEKLLKFKKWFWSIVEKTSNSDRQDLVSAKKKKLLYFHFGVLIPGSCRVCCAHGIAEKRLEYKFFQGPWKTHWNFFFF